MHWIKVSTKAPAACFATPHGATGICNAKDPTQHSVPSSHRNVAIKEKHFLNKATLKDLLALKDLLPQIPLFTTVYLTLVHLGSQVISHLNLVITGPHLHCWWHHQDAQALWLDVLQGTQNISCAEWPPHQQKARRESTVLLFQSHSSSSGDNRASSSLPSTMQSICSLWHHFAAFCKTYSPPSLRFPSTLWLMFFPGTAKLWIPFGHYSSSLILTVSCFSSFHRVVVLGVKSKTDVLFCFVFPANSEVISTE